MPPGGVAGARPRLVLQIHDELVFEIEATIAEHVADGLVDVLQTVLSRRKIAVLPLIVSKSLGANLHAL